MSELTLYIKGGIKPALVKTVFKIGSSSEPRISVRGKTPGAHSRRCGTFQWTLGVHAMTILAVRTAQWRHNGSAGEIPKLVGERPSPAMSFDFALGKPPGWLVDMFGLSPSGQPIAKRCFLRSNPENKSSGPTCVAINDVFLPPTNILVVVDDELLADAAQLEALARQLEEQWSCGLSSQVTNIADRRAESGALNSSELSLAQQFNTLELPPPFDRSEVLDFLKAIFKKETREVLHRTDIFSNKGRNRVMARIAKTPSFTRLFDNHLEYLNPLTRALEPSERLGFSNMVEQELRADEPIKIALPMALPGAMAILSYLKNTKGYNLEIDYRFIHAIEISRAILNHRFESPPDVCALGLAPAGTLMGYGPKTGYQPVMFLPMLTHRVLASSQIKKKTLHSGHYMFLDCDPSTSGFYFEELSNRGDIAAHKVRTDHGDPDDISEALSNGDDDLRAIIYFPYCQLNRKFNNCDIIDTPVGIEHMKEFILFAHESLRTRPRRLLALEIAIRDAWLTLRSDRTVMDSTIDFYLGEREYLKFLSRCAGFDYMVQSEMVHG